MRAISARDRDLIRRLTLAIGLMFVFAAAFSRLHLLYAHKFFGITGSAQWIWAHHRMSADEPVAFFATREIDLPERRIHTHLNVLGDPEYTLYLNGREIAARRVFEDHTLDRYDVSDLAKTGRNRIVVAVRAPRGVGGLIASVDIAIEARNWVVTDTNWRIYRRWHPDLLERDPPGVPWETPVVIGQPPIGRWNFLELERRQIEGSPSEVVRPRESFPLVAYLPAIRTREGVAVAVAERAEATAFDFGFTRGRLRLTATVPPAAESRAVPVRLANDRSELEEIGWNLRPVVFAPGETEVTTSEAYGFRYVMVFASDVNVEVVRDGRDEQRRAVADGSQ